ncbi:efflux RND transporter permease subunit [Thiomicrorhabdus indica]|uniref:efflux RND transporter permease subunit n=1 Tax=Thiomicrorhabdus indica TaxID=2267253 RepID=UPI00102DFD35|nr:efflux RND transporter permease subunit [Thiomicrorhabdus indica]
MRALLSNTVLTNLVFVLVLAIGLFSYQNMPRQQDPTINFNWIVIVTALPGASAEDIEKRVTQPLEDALRKVRDVNFVSSTSRVGLSNILLRFEDIDTRTFDKRVNDLRREIQNKQSELPEDTIDPTILEITSANAYPSAMVVLKGQAYDEILRANSYLLQRELERIEGIDRVDTVGLNDPELQVTIDSAALANHGLTPAQLADIVASQWQDTAAGKISIAEKNWLVRHLGQSIAPEDLAHLKIPLGETELSLSQVAQITFGQERAAQQVSFEDQPAVLLAVMKKDRSNTIELIQEIDSYLEIYNAQSSVEGVTAILADDQTLPTKNAISLMENNALQGLILVLLVSWLFLGWRVGLLVGLAIPFALAGVFSVLYFSGDTLNLTVLLGVVIALGMLVDVAVVMVEAMLYRLHQGLNTIDAALEAMKEIGWPIFAAVLTTIAAFLPLMLMPGILGDFMRVVPLVVAIALTISLIQAFWILPSQTHLLHLSLSQSHHLTSPRERLLMKLRNTYGKLLIKSFRHPVLTIGFLLSAVGSSVWLMASGKIETNFFASDTLRIFYVNVEMPSGTELEATLQKVKEVEHQVRGLTKPEDIRSITAYSGQMFTETEPKLGDQYGQLFVSLAEPTENSTDVNQIIEVLREKLPQIAPAGAKVSLLKMSGGPPSSKPISVKVRGEDYETILAAIGDLTQILEQIPGATDITNDASLGSQQLITHLDMPAIRATGLDPLTVVRTLRLMADGEVVAQLNNDGQEVDLRIQSDTRSSSDIDTWLNTPIATPKGVVSLSELLEAEVRQGFVTLKHHNFSRAITLEADLDKTQTDTLVANQILQDEWAKIQSQHPGINLDFSGELDEINESLEAMQYLFILGIGIMYLILGAQFNSYLQPLIILVTIPMAFTGVAYGLWLSNNPLSLYTLYGVVALSGIAVNSAIVLIAAANERRIQGMSILHSIVYAARRRLTPIIITATTTMSGLMALALGSGGHSLMFSPVATAIVWGIFVSTLLTLFTIPLLYRLSVRT